jgi:hypothetical protein
MEKNLQERVEGGGGVVPPKQRLHLNQSKIHMHLGDVQDLIIIESAQKLHSLRKTCSGVGSNQINESKVKGTNQRRGRGHHTLQWTW